MDEVKNLPVNDWEITQNLGAVGDYATMVELQTVHKGVEYSVIATESCGELVDFEWDSLEKVPATA